MHKLLPLRALRQLPPKYGIIPSDVLKNDSINKITHNLNSIKSENHDSLPTSSYSIIDMYTQQYFEDYKQFKRAAAAERYARAKDYFNQN